MTDFFKAIFGLAVMCGFAAWVAAMVALPVLAALWLWGQL